MSSPARRAGGAGPALAAALALALSLAACQHLGRPAVDAPAAAARPAAPVAAPADPVLAFVAQASPGQSASLVDPVRGRVEVRLEREYFSADGVFCRRFTLSVRQDTQTRVACRQSEGWQLDSILGRGVVR